MKFGLSLPNKGDYGNIHKLVELAVSAEEAGWDGQRSNHLPSWRERVAPQRAGHPRCGHYLVPRGPSQARHPALCIVPRKACR